MKRFRSLLSLTLIIAMLLGIVNPVSVSAASNKYYWNYAKSVEYRYNDGKWKQYSVSNYKFDKKGRNTKYTYKTKDWSYSYKVSYNSKGSSSISYENGKKTGKYVCTIDKNGRILKGKDYNAKGKLISTETYKYDSKGNTTKITYTYTDKSKKKEVDTYKNTYKGKTLVKRVAKYSSGGKEVTEYSKKGIIKKSTYTSSSGYKSVSTYDSKGRIKKNTGGDEYFKSESTYTYDKKGNITKRVESNTNYITNYETGEVTPDTTTETYTFKYKFDKNKNTTQRIEYRDGELYSKTTYSGYKKFKSESK